MQEVERAQQGQSLSGIKQCKGADFAPNKYTLPKTQSMLMMMLMMMMMMMTMDYRNSNAHEGSVYPRTKLLRLRWLLISM